MLSAAKPPDDLDPRIARLVKDWIGCVADKWTMLILEVSKERGELRFARLGESVEGTSQKMLTQTLRQMERDGSSNRTVHPIVPPGVDYKPTQLGVTLGAASRGVWKWAEENLNQVAQARAAFVAKNLQN